MGSAAANFTAVNIYTPLRPQASYFSRYHTVEQVPDARREYDVFWLVEREKYQALMAGQADAIFMPAGRTPTVAAIENDHY